MAENNGYNEQTFVSLFDRFDKTAYAGVLSDYTIAKIKNTPEWNTKIVYKINMIKKFVSLIQKQINSSYSDLFGRKFSIERNLIFYTDYTMPRVFVKMRISQRGISNIVPVSLNIPLDKLLSMPALEFYSILSAAANDVVRKAYAGKVGHSANINLDNPKTKNDSVVEKVNKIDKHNANKNHAEMILCKYLEEFLPNYCDGEFVEFDDISKLIAGQIVADLNEEQLNEMLSAFFDLSKFDDVALSKVATFTGKDLVELRASKLSKDARNLLQDPSKEPEALSATQQYQALMSINLKNQYKSLIAGSGNIGVTNSFDVKNFCINYANTFMESNGLKPIKITFDTKGGKRNLGEYIDGGGLEQSININLANISSVNELVSTLSHELTHAVESSNNKIKGIQTAEGYGLLDNISNDISKVSGELNNIKLNSRNTTAMQFLKELNQICYHINPSERNARYGELSALKFMSAIAGSKSSEDELNQTIEAFSIYQNKTRSIIENLQNEEYILGLQKTVDEILNSNISANDKEYFSSRIKYIKEMIRKKETFNISKEQEAIKEVQNEIRKRKGKDKNLPEEINEFLAQPGM